MGHSQRSCVWKQAANTAGLTKNIESEIQMITLETVHHTFQNMERRVQACLEAQGGYFQHLL
jgi:hypothetical protein